MLEARSVAVVGASPRPGTLGQRMVAEVARSPASPAMYLVNPRYREIGGVPCHPSLAALRGPVDLVLLGVPDAALAEQVELAARRGDRSAVIFGGANGPVPVGDPGSGEPGRTVSLRDHIATTARAAGMALCGAGCMGFVNVGYGLRAIGYQESDQLPAGPVALVTQSGSVFSAMLRTRRALGYTVAVSSGQELVTTAAQYAAYALTLPETRVLALVLEAMRDAGTLRQVLEAAAVRQIPVVLLTAGRSAAGRALVTAHSGALAGADGAWEALAGAYGVHRVTDLAELADTLELFTIGRRAPPGPHGGIATVHDSGLERAHIADLASDLGVPFAPIGEATTRRLAEVLDPGLEPGNPLDMWGASTKAQWQLTESLAALADDPAVGAVALAVDLVTEFDGDRSYTDALADAARRTGKPLAVLANIPSAVDPAVAGELRAAGLPVLEGARSGLLALGHLLAHGPWPGRPRLPPVDTARRDRWLRVLRAGPTRRHGRVPAAARLRDSGRPGRGARTAPVPRAPRPPRSGTPWCSRPPSRAWRTSRTRAGWYSASATRRPWRPRTRAWRRGWARGCWCARRWRLAPSCRRGSSPTRTSGRWSSWARAGSWWSTWPTGRSRCRRWTPPGPGGCCPGCACPGCSPGSVAGRPPTPAPSPPRSPVSRRLPASWAAPWPPWTSTR